jgi:hypothetical protein
VVEEADGPRRGGAGALRRTDAVPHGTVPVRSATLAGMAKADPRETTDRTGPVRTSSGTRVAAGRLTPLAPGVPSRQRANDVNDMPTRELDSAQLRAMALRCASDVDAGGGAHDPAAMPAAGQPRRRRLELVLAEVEAPPGAIDGDLADREERSARRHGGLALVLVLTVLAMVAVAAYRLYGIAP